MTKKLIDSLTRCLCLCMILVIVKSHGCRINNNNAFCQNLSLEEFPYIQEKGVTCVNVSYNKISHLDLNSLKNYKDLNEMDASVNRINFIGSGSFLNHSSLVTLILTKNNLSEFNATSVFAPVSDLHALNLNQNQLIYVDVANLEKLAFLDVAGNRLKMLVLSESNMKSLEKVNLNSNDLEDLFVPDSCSDFSSKLKQLSLQDNHIKDVLFLIKCRFVSMTILNLADNAISHLQREAFMYLTNLTTLILDGNPISAINGFVFNALRQLNNLFLNNLHHLTDVSEDALVGLHNLTHLEISGNKKLCNIHHRVVKSLDHLRYLDASRNNLARIDSRFVLSLPSLKFLDLSHNAFGCDCRMTSVHKILLEKISRSGLIFYDEMACGRPRESKGLSLGMAVERLNCSAPRTMQETIETFAIGSTALLDCGEFEDVDYVWSKTSWGETKVFSGVSDTSPRPKYDVLSNGSLKIDRVESGDAGRYECRVASQKTPIEVVHVRLDFGILRRTELASMMFGLIASASFLTFAVLFAAIKACSRACSEKEKKKKTSMQEVLAALKSNFQIDRLQSYKSAQIERFTAFRSATFEHLSAFKSARVSRLRKYKQASVNGVLHCLDRMRIHYSNQTVKIKVNCQQQFDRLRESYVYQKLRFRDNRSQQVRKIRDHYHDQAMRIKDYGSRQMCRLREQYKHQQQHLMKLLELLEVGNCIHVIEADCSRTESIIFDSDIADCDLDVQSDSLEVKDDDRDSQEDVFDSLAPLDEIASPHDSPKVESQNYPASFDDSSSQDFSTPDNQTRSESDTINIEPINV